MKPASPAATWWMAVRPRTLGASLVPVLIGLVYAGRTVDVDLAIAGLTAGCALALQVATNLANDYYDHASGIDTAERLGPPRVVQSGLLRAEDVRLAAFAALGAALLMGGVLALRGGWPIVAIGASAAISALAYSAGPVPLAALGFGEVLAFLYFGVLAVCGTAWLQGVAPGLELLLVASPIALLVTAIMLVNNLRDIPTDRAAGKRTLAVLIGDNAARRLYGALVAGAFVATVLLVPGLGWGCLLPSILLPLAWHEAKAVEERQGSALNLSLAGTARLHLLFGLAFAVGLATT